MKEGWEYKKLGEVCSPKKQIQRAVKKFSPNDRIKYIDISSIDNTTQSMTECTDYIMSEAPSRAQQCVQKGDIVLSTVRPNLKNIAIVDIDDENLVASSGFCVLRPVLIERNYLYHYITSDYYTNHLMSLTTGANYPAVRDSDVLDSIIPLPPLSIQHSIVSELDEINNLLTLKRKELEIYDKLAQSLFYEMFGDPVENEKGWEVVFLKNVLRVIGGYAFKSDQFKEYGIPVLRIGNINSGTFMPVNMVYWKDDSKLDRYKILPGDLVMSLTGTVGKSDYGNVCILDDTYKEYYLNQRNAKLELTTKINKYYLSYLLKNDEVKNKLTGINRGVRQANIANRDIENLSIPLPPLPLQQLFAQRIEAIEQQKAQVKAAIEKLETLLAARMQYWFE